jgi:DNA-binding MltR family transcriptional regulator
MRKGNPEKEGRSPDYMHAMRGESDRGAVLIAAAFIDDCLERLLNASLVHDPGVAKRLFEYPGPCSTLSARCDIAFCCALIGKDVRKDIRTIITIRNHFAHTRESAQFTDKEITAMCLNTELIKAMVESGTTFGKTSTRSLFLIMAGALISKLQHAARVAKHLPLGPSLKEMLQPNNNPFGY